MSRGQRAMYRSMASAASEAIAAHRLRSLLTASSMAAAVVAVVLVATVAATGSDFVLAQIEGVGSNLVYAYYEAGGNVSASEADYIDWADVAAVRNRLGERAVAVAGVATSWDTVAVDGRPMQVRVLGSSQEYRLVRNLALHSGRFLDTRDLQARSKVCLVTPRLAAKMFGAGVDPVGLSLKVHGVEFRIIGQFSEAVETFGQSEVSDHSVLVPSTVLRRFLHAERVDPLYVSVRSHREVGPAADMVRRTLESRHRPGSSYRVDTLSGILETARRILKAMSLAMILVASVTLAVSGVFIMNTMLMAVSERRAEIGIRRAVGATRHAIAVQFLLESLALASFGGLCGLLLGLALPRAIAGLWPALAVRVPLEWAACALLVAAGTGVAFGLLPALRASRMDPVEALRHE